MRAASVVQPPLVCLQPPLGPPVLAGAGCLAPHPGAVGDHPPEPFPVLWCHAGADVLNQHLESTISTNCLLARARSSRATGRPHPGPQPTAPASSCRCGAYTSAVGWIPLGPGLLGPDFLRVRNIRPDPLRRRCRRDVGHGVRIARGVHRGPLASCSRTPAARPPTTSYPTGRPLPAQSEQRPRASRAVVCTVRRGHARRSARYGCGAAVITMDYSSCVRSIEQMARTWQAYRASFSSPCARSPASSSDTMPWATAHRRRASSAASLFCTTAPAS